MAGYLASWSTLMKKQTAYDLWLWFILKMSDITLTCTVIILFETVFSHEVIICTLCRKLFLFCQEWLADCQPNNWRNNRLFISVTTLIEIDGLSESSSLGHLMFVTNIYVHVRIRISWPDTKKEAIIFLFQGKLFSIHTFNKIVSR